MAVTEFRDDDAPYLQWASTHEGGFVINTHRVNPEPRYMVLHRASCWTIRVLTGDAKPGGFTERTYQKICAESVKELSDWVRKHGRPDGSFSKRCGLCGP